MGSKMVAERQASSVTVQAAVAEQFGEAAKALSKLTGNAEVGKAATVVVEALASLLAEKTNAMVAADDKLVSTGSNDVTLRENRDAATEKVRTILVELRDAVGTGLKLPGSSVGLDAVTLAQPDDLLRQSQGVAKSLSDNDPSKLATRPMRGFKFDRDAWLTELTSANKALEVALAALARDVREDQGARLASATATAGFDATFSATTQVTSALLNAAGLQALANRLRPSERKSGTLAGPDEDPTA